jgi:hypothetical protein
MDESSNLTVNPYLYRSLPFDAAKFMCPIREPVVLQAGAGPGRVERPAGAIVAGLPGAQAGPCIARMGIQPLVEVEEVDANAPAGGRGRFCANVCLQNNDQANDATG